MSSPTYTVALRRDSDQIVLSIPDALIEELKLSYQDTAEVTATADGFTVRFEDTVYQRGIEAADRASKRYANALRALADT